jgi:hypothetical protein
MRMAKVLADGGFPIEALPALRESVEAALRSRALLDGRPAEDREAVPLDWIGKVLPQHVPFLTALRGAPEAVLAVGEEEARGWIAAGRLCVDQVREMVG